MSTQIRFELPDPAYEAYTWLLQDEFIPAAQPPLLAGPDNPPGGQAIPEAAACGRRAALTSRTNVVFSIPMLFYMGAARHYTLFGEAGAGSIVAITIIGGAIIAAIELNALAGSQGPTKKPLDTVGGALWSGFILTAVLFILFMIIF